MSEFNQDLYKKSFIEKKFSLSKRQNRKTELRERVVSNVLREVRKSLK